VRIGSRAARFTGLIFDSHVNALEIVTKNAYEQIKNHYFNTLLKNNLGLNQQKKSRLRNNAARSLIGRRNIVQAHSIGDGGENKV
jgi:hypothetical protein